MLDSFIEQYTYSAALENFNLTGDQHQLRDLKLILYYLCSVPSGRKLVQQAASSPTKLTLAFNSEIITRGVFHRANNSIDLLPVATNIPEQTEIQRQQARLNMALLLAHELHHFIHKDKISQFQKSAANINDYSFACSLIEADAYLWQEITYEELRSKYYPHVYLYHHPNDPEGTMRQTKTPEDPEFKKYNGRVVNMQFQDTTDFRKKFLQKALSGQNESLNLSVRREVNEIMPNAPLKFNTPSPPEFYESAQFFLQDTNSNISVDEALNLADLPPRAKHQRSWFSRLIHTR